jgi:hypothetical protein
MALDSAFALALALFQKVEPMMTRPPPLNRRSIEQLRLLETSCGGVFCTD